MLGVCMATASSAASAQEQPVFSQTRAPESFTATADCDLGTPEESYVVRDAAVIGAIDGPFSLETALNAINLDGANTAQGLLSTMLDSLDDTSRVHPESQLPLPLQNRATEAAIDPADFLAGLKPVGLFNHFDLADPGGADCGEYRIVYARDSTATFGGPMFLIFEARMPNPNPSQGVVGCVEVADFWRDLANLPDAAAKQAALEEFYFGNPATGDEGVINFENFSGDLGQIRTNFFTDRPWQLREFKTGVVGGVPELFADPVNDSPLAQFFDERFDPASVGMDPVQYDALRADFLAAFTGTMFDRLVAPELANGGQTPDALTLINSIGLGAPHEFVEFQSDADFADDLEGQTTGSVRALVQTRLDELQLGQLTPEHILNRANAMTCGGCHQSAVGNDIAPNVQWPASLSFFHISETGDISDALKDAFIPARRRILEDYLCEHTCETNADCSDGAFCNGEEACTAQGRCEPGVAPCEGAACDEEGDQCLGDATTLTAQTHCLTLENWQAASAHTPSPVCAVGAYQRGPTTSYDYETLAFFDTTQLSGTVSAASLSFTLAGNAGVDSIDAYRQDHGFVDMGFLSYASFPATPWTDSLGSVSVGADGVYTVSGPQLQSTVQAWIDGTQTNDGVVLAASTWHWGFTVDVSNVELHLEF